METNQLEVLAHIVLPSEILNYFSVVGIKQTSTEIHIHLDELMNPDLSGNVHFESKGFMNAVSVTYFPIDLDVVCKGTRYSKVFGAFLKETYGDIPGDLPYA